MSSITHQRCFNHSLREAAARCPGCRRFYCRECIVEHEGKVLCAACLGARVEAPLASRRAWLGVWRAIQALAGLITVWLFFYGFGKILLAAPSSFHEGTLWRKKWFQEP